MGRRDVLNNLFGGMLTVGAGALLAAIPPSPFREAAAISGLALVAAGTAGFAWLLLGRQPQSREPATMAGDNYNNSGVNYGHMGPVYNGKGHAELTPAHIRELLATVPAGSAVRLQAVGGAKAMQWGEIVRQALTGAGHRVDYETMASIVPPPPGPFSFSGTPDAMVITLAPDA